MPYKTGRRVSYSPNPRLAAALSYAADPKVEPADAIGAAIAEVETEARERSRDEQGRFINEDVPVRPISLNDLASPWGAWFMDRLRQTWTHLPHAALVGRVRGWMVASDYWLNRCGDAVLLGRLVRHELELQPDIEAIFLFVQDYGERQGQWNGARLYRECGRWGQRQGAKNLLLAHVSDIPPGTMRELMKTFALLDKPIPRTQTVYRIHDKAVG